VANEDLIWIDGGGSSFTLQSTGSADREVTFGDGLGLPLLVHQAEMFPLDHGSLDLARRFKERRVRLGFHQSFSSRANWYAGRLALAAAFNPALGMGQLKWVDASGTDYRLDCWVVDMPLDLVAEASPKEIRTTLTLWAPWPFWRPAAATSSAGTFSGTTPVNIAITNGGHLASVPLTITITGQATSPLIEIVGTNKKIDLRHTITAGQTAVLTCFPPDAVTALKSTTNLIGDLTYDSTLAGFALPRGSVTVRITGGSAGDNGTVTLAWYPWYLAV